MKIIDKILEPYFIDADKYSFNVFKRGETKKGEYKEELIGYFTTADIALKRIVKLKINDTDDVYDLEKYVLKLKKEYSLINDILK